VNFKHKNLYFVAKSYLEKKAYLNKDKHEVLENVTVLAGMCKMETERLAVLLTTEEKNV
jgi:hypothetical protein